MPQQLSQKKIKEFQSQVYRYFDQHGRVLPWRKARRTPYQIYVSEVMLQQTQVDRVAEKFQSFMRAFSSFNALAAAPFSEVLKEWQGLGYNRRARFLHESAKRIVSEFGGRLPNQPEIIRTFPGIGAATAASICAFGFNMPVVFIETNIRSVFIHHFFADRDKVSDEELLPLVVATLDTKNPYRWYSALMDYGVYLKKQHGNPSRRSRHHVRQARFEGSDRQIRGAIVRLVSRTGSVTLTEIIDEVKADRPRVVAIVKGLEGERLISRKGRSFVAAE